MKSADNFNPGKWLVENKITTQSRLNEINETVTEDEIIATIKMMNQAAESAGFQLYGKINTKPGKRLTSHAVWALVDDPSRAIYLLWSKLTGLYVSVSKGGMFPISGTPQEWSDKLKWENAF